MKQVYLNGLSVEDFMEGLSQLIKEELKTHNANTNLQIEVIDRPELLRRLSISEPTCIAWEKKGKIPVMRLGSLVRYNWFAVVKALEK